MRMCRTCLPLLCYVVGLLLMDVPASRAQATLLWDCSQKVMNCSTAYAEAAGNLSTIVQSSPVPVDQYEATCLSLRQVVSSCVTEARALCAELPDILATLGNLEEGVNVTCGPSQVCAVKASACQAPILAAIPSGPPEEGGGQETNFADQLLKMCPVYQEVLPCLQGLDATCQETEAVKNILTSIAAAAAGCGFDTGIDGTSVQGCTMQAMSCQIPLASAFPQGPPAEGEGQDTDTTERLQTLCPLYGQVKPCLDGLDPLCQDVEVVRNITNMISQASAGCAALSGGGTCLPAMSCFGSLADSPAAALKCQAMTALLTCLGALKNTCSMDETKVSFSKLESLMSSFCSESDKFPEQDLNCSSVNTCMETSPALGLSVMNSAGEVDIAAAMSLVTQLAQPPGLCQMLEVGVGCAVSSKDACQYSDDFVAAMATQQQTLRDGCAGTGAQGGEDVGDGSGKATRSAGNILLWLAAPLAAVMTSIVV